MNGALIVLDLGHVGRTSGKPPAIGLGHREDVCVVQYAAACARVLLEAGCTVELAGAGAYPARRRAARDAGASAYLNLHCNAGGGDYGLVLHSDGDRAGRLSREVASALRSALPEVRRWLAEPAGPPRWSDATLSLVSGTACPALVVEPGFLDRPEHRPLWTPDGLRRVGEALATGVIAWLAVP